MNIVLKWLFDRLDNEWDNNDDNESELRAIDYYRIYIFRYVGISWKKDTLVDSRRAVNSNWHIGTISANKCYLQRTNDSFESIRILCPDCAIIRVIG